MAKRLLALMDDWGVRQAAIVGHDMGGQPALAFSAGHPKRVSHLVVMNSLVIWDEKTSWEINLLRRFGWNRVLLERLPRAVFSRAIRTFLPRSYRLPHELRDDLWECFQQREVRHFVVRLCAGYQGAFRNCGNRIRQSRLLPCFSGQGEINIFLSRMAGNWVRSYRKRKSKRFRKRSTGWLCISRNK
jgi:pimeloyl-ACP methyl ester carboxylesterase